MAKARSFLVYLVLALLGAGLFGSLHDQISYTVSEEYFTKFKFIQFGLLDTATPERMKVAAVGFFASWWMGLPLGLLGGLAGLRHRTPARMHRALMLSLPLMAAVTLAVALAGLAYGYVDTTRFDLAAYPGWFIPDGLAHPRRFLCAGYMHNAAYLGGVLAVPAAWAFHFRYRRLTAL